MDISVQTIQKFRQNLLYDLSQTKNKTTKGVFDIISKSTYN